MSPPIPQIPLWLKSLAIQWVEKPNLWGGDYIITKQHKSFDFAIVA